MAATSNHKPQRYYFKVQNDQNIPGFNVCTASCTVPTVSTWNEKNLWMQLKYIPFKDLIHKNIFKSAIACIGGLQFHYP